MITHHFVGCYMMINVQKSERKPTYEIIDNKILSNSLVINIADHCNLSCSGCGHLSPVLKKHFLNPQQLYSDLLKLSAIYRTKKISLVGGEPLLNKNITEIISLVKMLNMCNEVEVITNGHLLGRMTEDFWDKIDSVRISIYPNYNIREEIMSNIIQLSRRYNVKLSSETYSIFRRSVIKNNRKNEDLTRRIYKSCLISHKWHCNTVRDGFFFKCPQSYLIPLSKKDENFKGGVRITGDKENMLSIFEYLISPDPEASCASCLATTGTILEHQQVNREKWWSGFDDPNDLLVDYDYLSNLESGYIADVPVVEKKYN